MKATSLSIITLTWLSSHVYGFVPVSIASKRPSTLCGTKHDGQESELSSRRDMLYKSVAAAPAMVFLPFIAEGKVEGYAPPPKKELGEDYRQGTAALGASEEDEPIPREAYKKQPSGLVYADIRTGTGEAAKEGSRVNLQWVLRKGNGYFVDSSAVNDSVPFIFTIGDGKAIKGVDEGVRGMKVGGTRRLLIPVNMAYVEGLEDGKPGPLPVGFGPRQQMRRVQNIRKDVPGEYVFLEVQLTRMR